MSTWWEYEKWHCDTVFGTTEFEHPDSQPRVTIKNTEGQKHAKWKLKNRYLWGKKEWIQKDEKDRVVKILTTAQRETKRQIQTDGYRKYLLSIKMVTGFIELVILVWVKSTSFCLIHHRRPIKRIFHLFKSHHIQLEELSLCRYVNTAILTINFPPSLSFNVGRIHKSTISQQQWFMVFIIICAVLSVVIWSVYRQGITKFYTQQLPNCWSQSRFYHGDIQWYLDQGQTSIVSNQVTNWHTDSLLVLTIIAKFILNQFRFVCSFGCLFFNEAHFIIAKCLLIVE